MTNLTRSIVTALVELKLGFFLAILLLISLFECSSCGATPRSSYALFHRLGPSSLSPNNETIYEWQKRAVLEISTSGLDLENKHLVEDLHFVVTSLIKNNIEPLKIPSSSSAVPLHSLEYQISLFPQDSQELPGEAGHPDTGFAISSYPLCEFLSDGSSSKRAPKLNEYLNIWIRPTSISSINNLHPSSIHNLQLDLLGIHWTYTSSLSYSSSSLFSGSKSNSCDDPKVSSISQQSHHHSLALKSQLIEFIDNLANSTIKVSVRKPEKLVEPILKPYPIHKNAGYLPDGRVKDPGPEKGFLSKYWMYILPVVVLLVMGGGQPPEENGQASTERST